MVRRRLSVTVRGNAISDKMVSYKMYAYSADRLPQHIRCSTADRWYRIPDVTCADEGRNVAGCQHRVHTVRKGRINNWHHGASGPNSQHDPSGKRQVARQPRPESSVH